MLKRNTYSFHFILQKIKWKILGRKLMLVGVAGKSLYRGKAMVPWVWVRKKTILCHLASHEKALIIKDLQKCISRNLVKDLFDRHCSERSEEKHVKGS